MKALLVSAAAVGLLTAAPAFAQAGPQATANAGASAEIVTPIAVVTVDGIDFGTIAAGSGGTITMAPGGGLSSSSPNMLISGSTGNAATFNVSGGNGLAYSSTVESPIPLSNGVDTLTATLTRDGGNPALDGTGADSFDVIGSLAVPAGSSAGSYTGNFDVTVQYD